MMLKIGVLFILFIFLWCYPVQAVSHDNPFIKEKRIQNFTFRCLIAAEYIDLSDEYKIDCPSNTNIIKTKKVNKICITGTKYLVGPSRVYTSLQQVTSLLNPGDTVEVDGGFSYPGGVNFNRPGTPDEKIIIRGVRDANGLRPVISGGVNSVAFTTPFPYNVPNGGHHYIFEGFEVTGGSSRCIFLQAKDLTIRDCYVRDCPNQGILGADQGSGNSVIEYTEVTRCGSGTSNHQIYMATDQVNNPGSVFRMSHCYIHNATGGNNVKSRAERNEIYYNWIEGARYHELELIGADVNADGGNPRLRREDSEVVGNVLFKKQTPVNDINFSVVRIGGDGTGMSHGRYRFLNNTVLAGTGAIFRMFDTLESLEIHNNVFFNLTGNVNLTRTTEARWTSGQPRISGSNNWVKTGTINIPAQLTATISGSNPLFADVSSDNLMPLQNSPLVNTGILPSVPVPGYEFPNPLPAPGYFPPAGTPETFSEAISRPSEDQVDIGAYEYVPPAVIQNINGNRNVCSSASGHLYTVEAAGAATFMWQITGGQMTWSNTRKDSVVIGWNQQPGLYQFSVRPYNIIQQPGVQIITDIDVVVSDTLIWKGLSPDWTDEDNWEPRAVPQYCHDVWIRDEMVGFNPVLQSIVPEKIHSLLIEGNHQLILVSGSILMIEQP